MTTPPQGAADIVWRLRAEASTYLIPTTDSVLHREAAAEISRLRESLAAATGKESLTAVQGAAEMPPLPPKRRRFFCTRCLSEQCLPGREAEEHPPCAKCGYLGYGADCDYNDAELIAYARQHAAEQVAAERERCAMVCDDEARIRSEAGAKHPIESEGRGRCFAAARAAINCAKGVRSGEVIAAAIRKEPTA